MLLYLLIVLVGGALSLLGPWWMLGPVCFAACLLLARHQTQAFWVSAAGGTTVWLGYGTYLHALSSGKLTDGVVGIFTAGMPVLSGMPSLLVVSLVSTLVVGTVSGFSGLAGLKIRRLIRRPRG